MEAAFGRDLRIARKHQRFIYFDHNNVEVPSTTQHQKWLRILYSVLTSNNFTFESFALQKTFQYFSSSLRFFLSACYYFFPFYSALGCAPFAQHHRAMRYLICSYFYYLFSSSLRSYDFLFSRDGLSTEIAFCCAMMCSGSAR